MRSVGAALALLVLLGGCYGEKLDGARGSDAAVEDARVDGEAQPVEAGELDAAGDPLPEIDADAPPTHHDPDPLEPVLPTPPLDAAAPVDAADVEEIRDSGVQPKVDADIPPAPPVDPGTPPVDAGMPPADAGTPPVDAGAPPVDAGTPPVDAGTPPVDAGTPPVDAGTPPVDAGTPPVDAGTPEVDAGTPPVDSGTPPVDSGTPEVDAGTPPVDSGTPAVDSGTPEVDAGPELPTCSGPPGLYKDDECQVLSDGVQAYHPQYPLWSDGAIKSRFVYLPPGTHIDTSNPDRWNFPIGTRFYKTFAAGALRVETRVLVKNAAAASIDSWTLTTYAWSADQRSVSPASTSGVPNALGSGLDIPSQAQCKSCHNMTDADAPIGFNAIQLNHHADGVTLQQLLAASLLVNGSEGAALNVSEQNARIPGDGAAQAALGYLHGNCGHCHGGSTPRAGMRLWSSVGMTQLSDAPIYQTAVCHCLERWAGRSNDDGDLYVMRVVPGHAANSGIIGRMSRRGAGEQMPPIGTNLVDPTGLATVKAWINSLDPGTCNASPVACE